MTHLLTRPARAAQHPLQRAYLDNADFSTSPLEPVDTAHIVWGLTRVWRLRTLAGAPNCARRADDVAAALTLSSHAARLHRSHCG